MLSDLINVVETILKLLDLHTTWDRKLFDDHIKPLYDAMCKVHTDYIANFSNAKAAATNDVADNSAAKRVVELIEQAQMENQAVRRGTAAMARRAAAGNSQGRYPAEANAFFDACANYFSALGDNCEELALTPYSLRAVLRIVGALACEPVKFFFAGQGAAVCCGSRIGLDSSDHPTFT
jgi:hypothetical protein